MTRQAWIIQGRPSCPTHPASPRQSTSSAIRTAIRGALPPAHRRGPRPPAARAEESYITVAADHLVEDALPLVLRLVEVGERLTNGIATLSQLQRESMRLELCRVHDALLDRGYASSSASWDRAGHP